MRDVLDIWSPFTICIADYILGHEVALSDGIDSCFSREGALGKVRMHGVRVRFHLDAVTATENVFVRC